MTTRQTSREAYEELCKSGKLRGQQEQVLASIVRYGASTSGELLAKMEIDNVNAWRARFTELQERGIIAESGQRTCKQSGRRGVTWRFTGRTKPLEVKHRASAKQLRALLQRVVKACVVNDQTFAPSKTLIADIRSVL